MPVALGLEQGDLVAGGAIFQCLDPRNRPPDGIGARQVENLSGEDEAGIADLAAIGIKDRGVTRPAPVNPP